MVFDNPAKNECSGPTSMMADCDECILPQFVGGACECDFTTGDLTKTFTRTCPACATDCESERIESCTDGSCPAWTEWEDTTACQSDGTRIRVRDCVKDGAESDECPEEGASEIVACTPKECIDTVCDCDVDSSTFGNKTGACTGKINIKHFHTK